MTLSPAAMSAALPDSPKADPKCAAFAVARFPSLRKIGPTPRIMIPSPIQTQGRHQQRYFKEARKKAS